MSKNGLQTTTQALASIYCCYRNSRPNMVIFYQQKDIEKIQERTQIYTPMNWNLSGTIYPKDMGATRI